MALGARVRGGAARERSRSKYSPRRGESQVATEQFFCEPHRGILLRFTDHQHRTYISGGSMPMSCYVFFPYLIFSCSTKDPENCNITASAL
jgi:hypothetical protein